MRALADEVDTKTISRADFFALLNEVTFGTRETLLRSLAGPLAREHWPSNFSVIEL